MPILFSGSAMLDFVLGLLVVPLTEKGDIEEEVEEKERKYDEYI